MTISSQLVDFQSNMYLFTNVSTKQTNKQKKLLCILVKCILLIEAKMNVIWAVIGNKERNVERKCPEIKLGHSKK